MPVLPPRAAVSRYTALIDLPFTDAPQVLNRIEVRQIHDFFFAPEKVQRPKLLCPEDFPHVGKLTDCYKTLKMQYNHLLTENTTRSTLTCFPLLNNKTIS